MLAILNCHSGLDQEPLVLTSLLSLIQEQGAGDVTSDLGKAAAERQRQGLDWREASTPQAVDARACQPLPQVRAAIARNLARHG